jgi:hypothetical protein
MPTHPDLRLLGLVSPVGVAVVYILCCSLIKEPGRRNFNAIMIAGAGAAYLNGGLGIWEFAFTPVVTFLAYKGLHDYRYIGAGWVLHTIWDVVHHRYGTPIVPFAPASSAGCAICDLVLALWCFAGGPSVHALRSGAVAVDTSETEAAR